jgi:hypothetical protein
MGYSVPGNIISIPGWDIPYQEKIFPFIDGTSHPTQAILFPSQDGISHTKKKYFHSWIGHPISSNIISIPRWDIPYEEKKKSFMDGTSHRKQHYSHPRMGHPIPRKNISIHGWDIPSQALFPSQDRTSHPTDYFHPKLGDLSLILNVRTVY